MKHEKINYLEIPSSNLKASQQFFEKVFMWKFTPYGEDYLAFNDGTIDGGFYLSETSAKVSNGSVLVVFYSDDLDSTYQKILNNEGKISTETFEFPGGKRFHFLDPTGNEFAVWSEQ